MNIISFRIMLALVLVLGTGHSLAQDTDEEMEATMRLMGNAEAELPYAVIKEIKLPNSLLDRDSESPAVDNSEDGHLSANENRKRREVGLTNADLAREHGAEMSEQATEDRENRGRSEDPPSPPENPGPPQ